MKAIQGFTIILITLFSLLFETYVTEIKQDLKAVQDNQNAILQAIKNESSINTLSEIQTLLEDNKSLESDNATLTLDNEYKATYIKEFNEILHEQVNFDGMQSYYIKRNGGD